MVASEKVAAYSWGFYRALAAGEVTYTPVERVLHYILLESGYKSPIYNVILVLQEYIFLLCYRDPHCQLKL